MRRFPPQGGDTTRPRPQKPEFGPTKARSKKPPDKRTGRGEKHYKDDNCSSASEFIEKAILFYLGFIFSQENQDYLADVIPATVKGMVDESSNRMGRLLFKMAVELAVIENILAAVCEVDRQELKRLRGQCVEEIKRTNGMISFEQALQWQKE